jgi:hypothetical protein
MAANSVVTATISAPVGVQGVTGGTAVGVSIGETVDVSLQLRRRGSLLQFYCSDRTSEACDRRDQQSVVRSDEDRARCFYRHCSSGRTHSWVHNGEDHARDQPR